MKPESKAQGKLRCVEFFRGGFHLSIPHQEAIVYLSGSCMLLQGRLTETNREQHVSKKNRLLWFNFVTQTSSR